MTLSLSSLDTSQWWAGRCAVASAADDEPNGCRLLPDHERRTALSLGEHLEVHGPLPDRQSGALLDEIEAAGLTGRGGAGFPVARKMRAVVSGPAPRVVIGNGSEGEPASAKDKTLLSSNPHLVLDGLHMAATAIHADRAYLYVHDEPWLTAIVRAAIDERILSGIDRVPVELVTAPARFVSGEESAVASRVSGGPALPRPRVPRVFERGAFGRPTLVNNVESMAHVALIARHGAATFREVGHPDQPGTMLFTVSGATSRRTVVEAPVGVSLSQVVAAAGGATGRVGAVLLGGFHGTWLPWDRAADLSLANPILRPAGMAVGAGVVVLLPEAGCGVTETVRILDYLTDQRAGQCGHCVFGMPRLADTFAAAAEGSRRALRRIDDLMPLLERRGGCAHPDGTVRLVRSALTTFRDELQLHSRGRCSGTAGSVMPI